jgi:hypothetical protein
MASQRGQCPKRSPEAGLRDSSARSQVLKMAHFAERKGEKTCGTPSPADYPAHAEDATRIAHTQVQLPVLSEDPARKSSHALLSDAATSDTRGPDSVGYA